MSNEISYEELLWYKLCGSSNWSECVLRVKNKLRVCCPTCGGPGFWRENWELNSEENKEIFECLRCHQSSIKPRTLKRAPKEPSVEPSVTVSETHYASYDIEEDLIAFIDIRLTRK